MTLILAAHRPTAFAQLAITEVMSFGSTNGLELGFRRPDFWELTNFGMNEVNLNGYRWFDSGNLPFESRTLLPATTIRPGESIVFVRESTVVPDPNAFRIWWGPSLPSDLQIYYWPPAPGFDDASGDAVRLWDANSNLVDEVRFASAREGVTFTYDTNSGDFSEFSQEGWAGAFRAATGGDIGSPGSATIGPVALQITQQPISQTVEPGTEVILRVQATGRPVPQYRWYSNGVPVLTAGAGVSTVPRLVCLADCGPSWRRGPGRNDLVLLGIQPGQSGDYFVEVFNGLEKLSSAVATITVNTNPSLIQVECPPEESCFPGSETDATAMLIASPGQTAIFSVQNRGFPLPTFQWSHSPDGLNFTNLPGETHRDLTIARVEASDAGLYRVRLENALGATTALGRLTIRPSPWLEITEAMSWPCSPFGSDWWELTNTNAEPVNLCGYRWDDATGSEPTIGGGPTITNNVIVQPGESVILLESQTAESFVQWWGASNLPPKLQFITYEANGLGELGDSIHLWDPNETDPLRFVAWAEFSGAIRGETRWFDLAGCPSGEFGVASRLGSCGAFQADRDCDVGSPGWTRWTPSALTSVRRAGPGAVVSWSAQPGSINRVQFARQLAFPLTATVWEDLGEFQFPKAAGVTTDSTVGAEPQRFYRVRRVTAANCPCPEE